MGVASSSDDSHSAVTCCKDSAMKTDSQLRKDIQDELKFQPNIRETEIGVAVKLIAVGV
jgi:hypothetical protein